MTIIRLLHKLHGGFTIGQCFELKSGQECTIYKADEFKPNDEIIYIPDLELNEISTYIDHPVKSDSEEETDEIIIEILSCCYTGKDFLNICEGDIDKAEHLFDIVDWQHPSSALEEMEEEIYD